MSLFSEGAGTYPDTLLIATLVTFTILSTALNPLVFIYNYRKPNSLPKFLFEILSVLDFMTCLFYSAHHIKLLAEPGPPKCSSHEKYGAICTSMLTRAPITTYQRLTTMTLTILFKSPSCITALLTVCRFRQLKFPFRPVKIRFCVIFFVLYLGYSVCIQYYSVSDPTAFYYPPLGAVVTMTLFTGTKFQINNYTHIFFLQSWPLIICQISSILASLGTIFHLLNENKIAPEPHLYIQHNDSKRRTIKILITNVGSLILTSALVKILSMLLHTNKSAKLSMYLFYVSFTVYVLLPTFLSCLNPVVFLSLTPHARVPRLYCPSVPRGRLGSSANNWLNSASRDLIKLQWIVGNKDNYSHRGQETGEV